GSVSGVFAETKDGVLEVNAKAVVLAGGGWAANLDMLAEYGGYDMDITKTSCAPGSVGDTLKMAAAIGGREEAKARGYMFGNLIDGISSYSLPQYYPAIWVNENGERFANEDCGEPCHDYTGTAVGAQDRVYIVLNDAMVDEAEAQGNKDLRKEIEAAAGGASKAVFKGADAADLAKQAGWTGDFAETLATYEGYVAQQNDDEFGKNPKYLASFGEGPLYALMIHQEIALSLGGIITNRQWQVVGEGKQPIKNLYAIGADGQMVYLGLYNLNTSGGHMATNVESGRYAVKHALKTCF
ncbi:MAG: FAD-binding protein, partial [Eggerthella lenta]|nr:FAD-binding protein [Eggerthella lenta]